VVEVQHIQVLSYKGTGRDGTVMLRSVPTNVPLAVDVLTLTSFEDDNITFKGEVISSRLSVIMWRSHDRKY
jgi:hypothetical protein